jgi:phosphoglycolate phosphatase-like HAD superfamily hydrolase
MKKKIFSAVLMIAIVLGACNNNKESQNTAATGDSTATGATATDPLPSWNAGSAKQSIIDFVNATTKKDGKDFVAEPDRIACFDNDGTLWSEQPMYFQLAFAIDRIKEMAPSHPEWKTKQPFKDLLTGDFKGVMAGGEKALLEIIMTTHAGMTTDVFNKTVMGWMDTAKHPTTGKHYNEMIFQPMIELLQYLRANGYKTFIVSGGGVDFMRPWVEKAYGIEPYQVVGSSGKVQYDSASHPSTLIKMPAINFIDDKATKPVGIHQFIGKKPIFTAGNSDGDYQMLQWTSEQAGPHFGLIVHHTDSVREWAYDRKSEFGRLNWALDEAPQYKWLVVSMKTDWKKIYPYNKDE